MLRIILLLTCLLVAARVSARSFEAMREMGVAVQTGRFRAKMSVELANEGPVTIVLDSETFERPRRG